MNRRRALGLLGLLVMPSLGAAYPIIAAPVPEQLIEGHIVWTMIEQTPPNVGGLSHSHPFCQPSFSNQAKLCVTLETFKMGVR